MAIPLSQKIFKTAFPKTFSNIDALNTIAGILSETFLEEQYAWLVRDLKRNTTAIDLGASLGDSAVYLAMQKNIKRVEAYELFPYWYRVAKKNTAMNPNSSKIRLYNIGVSDHTGSVALPKYKHHGSTGKLANYEKHSGKSGYWTVAVTALNTILAGKRNVIIKCDIEGEEQKVFNEDADLENVYRLQIEYEFSPKNIMRVLEQKGFRVRHKKWQEFSEKAGHEYGWIYAEKRGL